MLRPEPKQTASPATNKWPADFFSMFFDSVFIFVLPSLLQFAFSNSEINLPQYLYPTIMHFGLSVIADNHCQNPSCVFRRLPNLACKTLRIILIYNLLYIPHRPCHWYNHFVPYVPHMPVLPTGCKNRFYYNKIIYKML